MAAQTQTAGWWKSHGMTFGLLLLFFAIAFFIRSFFNFEASYSDGHWRWSGTDPYYHMWVVDTLRTTGQFLLFDGMINYPIGATNPRPPLFDWTIAAVGGLLAPLWGGDSLASTSAVAAFAPPFWAALTVIPMYFLGKAAFGRTAGLWAAFFIAVMAAHVSRSALSNVDHDATVLFFLVLSAFALVKSLQLMSHQPYVADYRRGKEILPGWRRFFVENQASVAYAALFGASVAAIALTWQGYAYALAIFAVWFGFQLLSNHLRRRDSTGHMILAITVFIVTLAMIWSYYDAVNRIHSWVYPTIYIFIGILLASLIFVPTRHLPPVLVLPMTVGGILVGLLVLLVVFPDIGRLFFTGFGYFVQDKLYSTIAEAQRTPLGFLAFSTGVIPFFAGLAGLVFAVISFVKHKRDDHLFVLVWAGVALIMSFTATRFVFNSAAAFALLAGWVTAMFLGWVRFKDVRKSWRNVRSAGYNLFRSTRSSVSARHVLGAIVIVFLLVVPSVWAGVDAGAPREYTSRQANKHDEGSLPHTFWDQYFGAFGQDFLSSNWVSTLEYLRDQDQELDPLDRPAVMAWWDYGFYIVQEGRHPTVADPFQFGYEVSGRFLSSVNEAEGLTYMTIRLLEGDWRHGEGRGLDPEIRSALDDISPGLADTLTRMIPVRDYDGMHEALAGAMPHPTNPDTADLEEVSALYQTVRDISGLDIGYFAIDGRMFPCDDPRSGQIDSGSIFYAPLFLADKNPEDYVRTMYRDASGQTYFQRIYETVDGVSQQVEDPHVVDSAGNRWLVGSGRLFPMGDKGFVDYAHPDSIEGRILQSEELEYQDRFYETLFYRAWVGAAPTNMEEKIPPHRDYAPGQDLKHFRLVYTTVRLDEADEGNRCFSHVSGGGYSSGVAILAYYDGAPISGVVRDSDGAPMGGVEVRVADNFGIYHDRVETDGEGRWSLMAPFSTEDDASPSANRSTPFTMRATGPNQVQVFANDAVVASQNFSVSREQAMGQGPEIAPFELTVELGAIGGRVFEDVGGDGAFNETEDTPISGANVTLGDRSTFTDQDGSYQFDAVLPGSRTVTVSAAGYEDSGAQAMVEAGEVATADIPMQLSPLEVSGQITSEGRPVAGATAKFSPDRDEPDAEGSRTSSPATEDGNYTVGLDAGTWWATVDFQTFDGEVPVRYFTAEPVEVIVDRETGDMVVDLDLEREEFE